MLKINFVLLCVAMAFVWGKAHAQNTLNNYPQYGPIGFGTNSLSSKLSVAGTGSILTITDDETVQTINGYVNNKNIKVINTESNGVPALAHFDTKKNTTRTQLLVSNSADGDWSHNYVGLAVHGTSFLYNNQNDYMLNDNVSDAGLATLWAQGPSVTKFTIGGLDNFPMSFFTNNQERLTITETGDVGIGVLTPREKLTVNGTVLSTKMKVVQSVWPDYVFSTHYKLLPLKGLEEYIRQNKHLPDIPSAQQVEKEGLDLGSNQAALLKKIEELTLYVLQQNEKLEIQSKRLKALETKFAGRKK